MPHPADLFELIHSLTPSEKRYFKVHAEKFVGTGYKSQYEKLFDALNNWPEGTYDEKEFKKKSKGKTFLKNLPDEKAYLRDLLLKTLRNYHSENNTEAQLNEMFLNIRLLINKGLKAQAYDIIGRAKRIAEETEQLNELLVINDFLLSLYRPNPKDIETGLGDFENNEVNILERLKITRQAVHLRVRMKEIQVNGKWKECEAEVEHIMKTVASMESSSFLTKRAELSLLNVKQFYYVHHQQYQQSLDTTMLWLNKIEKSGNTVEYSADQYRVTLANFLFCAVQCEKFELLPPVIEKIKAFKTGNESEAADCFRLSAQYELVYLINSDKAIAYDNTLIYIEAGLKIHKRFIHHNQIVDYRFNIALLLFIRKRYADALKQINELYYLSGRDEQYVFTTTMARVIEWMCQASTDNFDVLENMNRNLKRYFADRKLKSSFFDLVSELFMTIIKEGRIYPPSLVSIKKRITEVECLPQWEQLKAIVLLWI